LFQVKTNCKPTKKQQEQIKTIKEESGVLAYWFNKVKGNLEVYH
jgi:hypothetical protein